MEDQHKSHHILLSSDKMCKARLDYVATISTQSYILVELIICECSVLKFEDPNLRYWLRSSRKSYSVEVPTVKSTLSVVST